MTRGVFQFQRRSAAAESSTCSLLNSWSLTSSAPSLARIESSHLTHDSFHEGLGKEWFSEVSVLILLIMPP